MTHPWFDDMTVEEFKEYYDQKLERIEELTDECHLDGCEKDARGITFDYCSTRHMNEGLEQAMGKVTEAIEEYES